MFEIVVIGGGPAGITAALRARELGAEVALIERGRLGGTCTNDGCVPTRVLAKAARLLRDTAQFEGYGLHASTPELVFTELLSRTQEVVYRLHEKKQMLYHLQSSGVTVFTEVGDTAFLDAHTVIMQNGTLVQGQKFILCSGGHSRRLDFPGEEFALTHRDVWFLKKLPRNLAIVGGAATGCQLASIFEIFGVQVTLLERAPRILRAEDEAVSAEISRAFQNHGIQMITGIEGIESIQESKSDKNRILSYRKDGNAHQLTVEEVILSSGWLGNVTSLNLEAAGVHSERNYIMVDEYMRTSVPHIFAAGDITGRMMLVQSAGFEARVAAENAVLGVGERNEHRIVPHGGFTDPEYGSVGLTEEQATVAGEYIVITVPYADLDRAVIDGRTQGFCKLIVSRETHRILGAHIVGEQALETIQLVAACMTSDMWVEQLAEMELAYPTFTSILGLAARQAMRALGVMPLSQQWQTMARPHAEWEQNNLVNM